MKLISLLWILLVATSVGAQELSYPELHVTPRASSRISMEVNDEASYAWKSHMPIQLSALTTLVAASALQGNAKDDKDDNMEMVPGIVMGVSAAWIGATAWAAMKYRPYANAVEKLKKLPQGSMREKLTLERLAEEEMNSLRSMAQKIKWLSVITNLGMSALLVQANPGDTDDQKQARLMANLSGVMAFAPLFFSYRWETVANEQEKYKKKIYAPVAYAPIVQDPFSLTSATGMQLAWHF
jgi:hypothetical protein